MCRRCPQPRGPRPCWGLLRTEARRPSPTGFDTERSSTKGLAPLEGQVEQSRPAPESSTLPSCSPSPQRPPKGTGGALGEGGGVASSEGKAPPS